MSLPCTLMRGACSLPQASMRANPPLISVGILLLSSTRGLPCQERMFPCLRFHPDACSEAQPSLPSASTCSCFSFVKTLAILDGTKTVRHNVSAQLIGRV